LLETCKHLVRAPKDSFSNRTQSVRSDPHRRRNAPALHAAEAGLEGFLEDAGTSETEGARLARERRAFSAVKASI